MSKSKSPQISTIVTKHFEELQAEIDGETLRPGPLINELNIINKAYKDIKVLPCERLTNHCDHFKFENKAKKLSVYLTTRDIGYAEYWKFILLEKIKSHRHQLVQTTKQSNDNEYYISSFIEPISIFDGEKEIETTPKLYLTKADYNGYCRPRPNQIK